MHFSFFLLLSLLVPCTAQAWDDDQVLNFIFTVNPTLQAQRQVTQAYKMPDTLTWTLQNTSVSGRIGFGGTDFRDDPVTIYGGLAMNIPLASPKEEREAASKRLSELKAVDSLRTKVMQDIASLRSHEANLIAIKVRLEFHRKKAKWLKSRMEQGYTKVDALWTIGDQLNKETADIERITLLANTQRHKIARYAGEYWQLLRDYLEDKAELKV